MATKKDESAAPVKKAPAAKKAPTEKNEATAKAPAPKAVKKAPAQQVASGGKLKVVQTGSPIGRQANQRATLIGLGLNKINRSRELADTPEVRGMLTAVKHLVKVEKLG